MTHNNFLIFKFCLMPGLPGARSLGGQDERGRLASGEESSPTEPEVGPSVKPPVVKSRCQLYLKTCGISKL